MREKEAKEQETDRPFQRECMLPFCGCSEGSTAKILDLEET